MQLHRRDDGHEHRAAEPADSPALNEALTQIASGKLGAARDRFRRDYFLAQTPDGAFTSFVLALLMVDHHDAWAVAGAGSPAQSRAHARAVAPQCV